MTAFFPDLADSRRSHLNEPPPRYGPITHRLMQARELIDSDLLLLHIDTALMLVRQAHHSRILDMYSGDGTNYTARVTG